MGTDRVADDADLRQDEVQCRDGERSPVADDEVGAARTDHGQGGADGVALADEVDHCLRALASGESLHAFYRLVHPAGLVGPADERPSLSASGSGSTAMISAEVRARRHWTAMCPNPPMPWTTTRVPDPSSGTALRTTCMTVSPASAWGATAAGSRPEVEEQDTSVG